MRVGSSPHKTGTSGYQPARVTVCVLVCIPDTLGYYAHRFDVLKLSLESLIKHTDGPYDVLVFDNGSCPEVVDFLRQRRDEGTIRFLILSSVNVGMAGAYRVMFNAAPGEVIAYSDDDILFHPGWLAAQLELLDTFPRVGMVSGVPVRHQFRYGNRYLPAYLEEFPSVVATSGHFIPDAWEREFFTSVTEGPNVERTLTRIKDALREVVLEYNGRKAYSTANHFQFISPKAVLLQGLPAEWPQGLMTGDQEMDERIDRLGYARLSTVDRYVQHIGNVITPDLAQSLASLGLGQGLPMWRSPNPMLLRVAHIVRAIRARVRRSYNWLYFLRNYKP